MPEPCGAAQAPRRNTSQQDHPHVRVSSVGNPRVMSNARAMQSSAGTPGTTPASTTAATSAPQTPDTCTRQHAPPLTTPTHCPPLTPTRAHNPRTRLDPERCRAARVPPEQH
ncbi:hypothetical protein DXG01_010810, partial [Tephrocybe rancida]